jgi:hypothetical protein
VINVWRQQKICGNNGQFMFLRLFTIKYQSNKDKKSVVILHVQEIGAFEPLLLEPPSQ